VYDEIYGQRPWKSIQKLFVQRYTDFLKKTKPKQAAEEKAVRQSEEYRKIEEVILEQEKALAPKLKEIDREVTEVIGPRLAALTDPFALARSEIQAVIYRVEVASSQSTKDSLSQDIEKLKARPVSLTLPAADGRVEKASMNFTQLEQEFNRLQQRKTELAVRRAELAKPVGELRAKLDAVMKERMAGLTETQVDGLLNKMRNFNVEIKQIHVKSVDLVDRCESCHLGIREPLTLTKADMGGEGAFTSHTTKALLQVHDPERFGCTPCHNGNGRGDHACKKAHGRYSIG
jgi:chromosome segregation ATPase